MIQNYIKVALGVLARNKLYTFISLFAISFTLMSLMLMSSFLENDLGKNAPLTHRDEIVIIDQVRMKGWKREEEVTIDSSIVDGVMKYDTIRKSVPIVGDSRNNSTSNVGNDFYRDHLSKIDGFETVSGFGASGDFTIFLNGKKMNLRSSNVDVDYWNIFDFKFREGGPFTKQEIDNQQPLIVIKYEAAKKVFGDKPTYIGEKLLNNGVTYTVSGVVEDFNTSFRVVNTEVWLPLTFMTESELNSFALFGNLTVAYKAKDAQGLKVLDRELRDLEHKMDLDAYERFDVMELLEVPVLEHYAQDIVRKEKGSLKILSWVVGVGLLLFLLIPTVNLINLNITRIMERSAEIGVRKSFGATTKDLLVQFIFENLILTLIGGAIGFILSLLAIYYINSTEIFGSLHMEMNFKLFLISLLITIVFGILSGIIPAWKMSNTQIAKALKTNVI